VVVVPYSEGQNNINTKSSTIGWTSLRQSAFSSKSLALCDVTPAIAQIITPMSTHHATIRLQTIARSLQRPPNAKN
jgi:hypothetical protein